MCSARYLSSLFHLEKLICKFMVCNISPHLRGRDLTDSRQGAPSPLPLCSDSRLAADMAPRLPLVVSSATPGPGDGPRPFSANVCPDGLYLDPAILISPDCKIRPKGPSYSRNKLVTAPHLFPLTKSPRLLARPFTVPLS